VFLVGDHAAGVQVVEFGEALFERLVRCERAALHRLVRDVLLHGERVLTAVGHPLAPVERQDGDRQGREDRQGDDDQVVPYKAAAIKQAELLPNATLKIYEGYPHGMLTTHADVINPDLLAFIQQ